VARQEQMIPQWSSTMDQQAVERLVQKMSLDRVRWLRLKMRMIEMIQPLRRVSVVTASGPVALFLGAARMGSNLQEPEAEDQ